MSHQLDAFGLAGRTTRDHDGRDAGRRVLATVEVEDFAVGEDRVRAQPIEQRIQLGTGERGVDRHDGAPVFPAGEGRPREPGAGVDDGDDGGTAWVMHGAETLGPEARGRIRFGTPSSVR
jgi:hypothetical protein